ncbi:hypothetical protein GQ600_25401 [Phytophthora cactorum]|nr:hypothetical protein GQ600_25401 [Phytophthora cactorum]
MPQSRELANKKNDHKDRQSRGPMGSAAGPKKGGAGAHNWASRPTRRAPSRLWTATIPTTTAQKRTRSARRV